MNSETGDPKQSGDEMEIDDEIDAEAEIPEETVVLDEAAMSTDNVGDVSVEINVEELVAKIEAEAIAERPVDGVSDLEERLDRHDAVELGSPPDLEPR